MRIHVLTRSSGSYGWDRTWGLAGRWFDHRLGEFVSSITTLEILVCFRGGPVLNESLQPSHEAFQASLSALPKSAFLRKRSHFRLEFETQVTDGGFLAEHGPPSAAIFRRALLELATELETLKSRVKNSDHFDSTKFRADLASAVAEAPATDEELIQFEKSADKTEKDRLSKMDPWERMDIDWAKYHPEARTILNDPFFWEEADDNAPHGNDTGADLLAEFRKWNRRNPARPAHEMARALLDKWGIAVVEGEQLPGPDAQSLSKLDPISLEVTDEAMIAVAFAAIKLRGVCDPATAASALRALRRERVLAEAGEAAGPDLSERIRRLEILESTLRSLTG